MCSFLSEVPFTKDGSIRIIQLLLLQIGRLGEPKDCFRLHSEPLTDKKKGKRRMACVSLFKGHSSFMQES